MLDPMKIYKELPTPIQALLAAIFSMMFNITVLIILCLSLSVVINQFERSESYVDVLGASTKRVVEIFKSVD